ncbi:MAG: FG-GAP-like repeat-containing protein [Elusimicrobiota bacterium]
MSRYKIIICALLISGLYGLNLSPVHADFQPVWTSTYIPTGTGTLGAAGWGVAVSSNTGDIFMVGYSSQNVMGNSWLLRKYSKDGTLLATTDYMFVTNTTGVDIAQKVVISGNNIYVAGVYTGDGMDIALCKFDFSLNIIATTTISTASDEGQYGLSLAGDNAGNIYLAAEILNDIGGGDSFGARGTVRKYDANLNCIWVDTWSAIGDSSNAKGIAANSSEVYACGQDWQGSPWYDGVLHKYDNSGSLLWVSTFGVNGAEDEFQDVIIDSYGDVYVTGFTEQFGTKDVVLRKYNASGTLLWGTTYNSPANLSDQGTGIALDNNGNIVVVGASNRSDIGQDINILLMHYTTGGLLLNVTDYDYSGSNYDHSYDVAFSSDGYLYVAAFVGYDGASSRMWLRKYSIIGNSPPPGKVTGLTAVRSSQVYLTWTSPGEDGYTGNISNGMWRIACTSDVAKNADTAEYYVAWSTNANQGTVHSRTVTGLVPRVTYYFWIQAMDDSNNWSVWSDSAAMVSGSYVFYQSPGGADGWGPGDYGGIAWGDFDNDNDLDIAVNGHDGSNNRFRIFRNDSGNFNLHADPAGTPAPAMGDVAWADFDNDGDLDIAVCGNDGASNRFRVYRNDSGTFNLMQEPAGVTGPGGWGNLATGDFDNDGYIDIAVIGQDGAANRFRVYRNEKSSFTLYAEPAGAVGPSDGGVAFGDYDNDGDLDLVVTGSGGFEVYKNNNGSFVVGQDLGGLTGGDAAWGDFDNDGDLDLAVCGNDGNRRFSIYRYDGGLFYLHADPAGPTTGPVGSVAWADYDNDGDLDVAVNGFDGTAQRFRIYRNDSGAFNLADEPMGPVGPGYGAIAFADFDGDGDLDVAVNGQIAANLRRFIIYKSLETENSNVNNPPVEPPAASMSAGYNAGRIEFTWSYGSDTETTESKGLYYSVRIATSQIIEGLDKWIVSPSTGAGASPFLGDYPHGFIVANSTQPGLILKPPVDDATYYWQVRTVDTGLKSSVWSATSSYYYINSEPPAAVTNLKAFAGGIEGTVKLEWSMPGDDEWTDALPSGSKFKVQYSTSSNGFPPNPWNFNAAQVAVSTSGVQPTTLVNYTITGLTGGGTYYFKIWHADEIPNWSELSNTATGYAKDNAGVIVSTGSVDFGNGNGINGRNIVRTSNGDLYHAYIRKYATKPRIFVSRSIDNGLTWSDATVTPIDYQGGSGGTNITESALAVDSKDVLHLAYCSSDNGTPANEGVFYSSASAPPGTSWTTAVKMPGSYPYNGYEHGPNIAVASDNSLHMVWYGEDGAGNTNDVIRYSSKTADSNSWNNYQLLPGGGLVGIFQPKLAIDNRNGLHVVMTRENAAGTQLHYRIAYTSKTLTDSAWVPLYDIVDFTGSGRFQGTPAIVVDSTTIHVVWTGQDDENTVNYQIKYSSKSITGSSWSDWVNIQTISEAPQYEPAITADAGGQIYVVWSGSDSANNIMNIKGSKYSAGAWGSWTNISNGGGNQTRPTLRWSGWFNNEGNLNLGWVSKVGSDYQIRSYTDYTVNMSTGFLADKIGPAIVTNLTAQAGTVEGRIQLTWSMPGDDGWSGALPPGSNFSIQYSSSSDGNPPSPWSFSMPQISMSTSGVQPGTLVNYAITGLTGGSTYYFKIWVNDANANWQGGLSNTATGWAMDNAGVIVSTGEMVFTGDRPIVRASNGDMYVAYTKTVSGYEHVFVAKSFDDGKTWSDTNGGISIENTGSYGQSSPSLAIDSKDVIHCAWSGYDGSYVANSQVKYCNSGNGGTSWSGWINLSDYISYGQGAPSLVIDSKDELHCLWDGGDPSYANSQIKYSSSTTGASWSIPANIQVLSGRTQVNASAAVDAKNNIHVFWEGFDDTYTANKQIKYSIRLSTSASWSTWVNIAVDVGGQEMFPSSVIDSSQVAHCVWQDYTSGVNQVKYSSSTIGSGVWTTAQNVQYIATIHQYNPTITVDSADELYCLWLGSDTASSIRQIKGSKNLGAGWTSWANISNGCYDQIGPAARWSGWKLNEGYLNFVWVSPGPVDSDHGSIRFYTDYSVNMSTGFIADKTGPAIVTNLTASGGYKENSIMLTWSAPGDDGWAGALQPGSNFSIQYSSSSDGNPPSPWSFAVPQIMMSTSGVQPGTLVNHVITGLTGGNTYYFKIWVNDEESNWQGGLSNTATGYAQTNAGVIVSTETSSVGMVGFGRKIVRDNSGNMYFAYTRTISSFERVYVAKSVDEGATWTNTNGGQPIESVGPGNYSQSYPSLAIDSNNILHCIWGGRDSVNSFDQIKYSSSTNAGSTWGAWQNIQVITGYTQYMASLFVDSHNGLHCVWTGMDNVNTAKYQIKYSSRATGGSWSDWVNVGVVAGYDQSDASLVVDSHNNLHCVWDGWDSVNTANWQVKYSSRSADGSTWSDWSNITAIAGFSQWKPSLAIDSQDILHCVWNGTDAGNAQYQIKYSSVSAGESQWSSWTNIQTISGRNQYNPSIAVDANDNLHCVWNGYDSANTNIFQIKYSSRSSTGWSQWANLSRGLVDQQNASLRWSNYFNNTGKLGIGWVDYNGTTRKVRYLQDNNTDMRTGADATPPDPVNTLAAITGQFKGMVNLSWTSPGDDGITGILQPGSRFSVQYSTSPAGTPPGSWDHSFAQVVVSTSGNPVMPASRIVTGLTNGSTYYFKIWYGDETPNWSGLSNTATSWAQVDNVGPAIVTTLSAEQGDWVGSVRLVWEAPGDDGWAGTLVSGSEFIIEYSTSPNNWGNPAQVIVSTSGIDPHSICSERVGGLDPGVTYYFCIDVKDEIGIYSGLSSTITAWAAVPAEGMDSLTQYNGGADGWMSRFSGGSFGDDVYNSVTTDPSGNVIAAGYTGIGANQDILVKKFNSSGTVLWTRYYNSAANGYDAANGVAADPSGNIIVAGYTQRTDLAEGYNIWVRKYDSNGTVLWTDTYNSPADDYDSAQSVSVDVGDIIYVVGSIKRSDISEDDNIWLRKYNPNGNIVWTSTYASVGNYSDIGKSVYVKGGNVYVAGEVYNIATGYDIFAARFNDANGLLQMATTFTGAGSFADYGNGITADSLGNFFVAGSYYDSVNSKQVGWVSEFNSAGVLVATKTYAGGANTNSAQSVALDGNGALYFTGYEEVSDPDYRIWTMKLGVNGLTNWTTYYQSISDMNSGNSVTVVSSSIVYVAGTTYISGENKNTWLRKYIQHYPNAVPGGYCSSTQTATSIRWDWADNATNEAGYRVKLSSPVYDPINLSHSGDLAIDATYWMQTGLIPNTSYTTYVEAFTFWGSTPSFAASTCTAANPPLNSRVVSRSSDTITIQWDANNNPGYTRWGVWYSTDNFVGSLQPLFIFGNNFTGYSTTHDTLMLETTYWYRVAAYNENSLMTDYDTYFATQTIDNIPPPIINVTANTGAGEGQVALNWLTGSDNGFSDPLPPGSQYRIQYSTDSVYPWNLNTAQIVISTYGITPATPVYYTVKGLKGGDTYYFKLWTADEIPNWTGLSQTATAYAGGDILVHVWNGGGLSQQASDEDNWVNSSAPDPGDRVEFVVAYSVKNCNWDLPIAISTMFVQAAYSQAVTITSFVYVSNYLDFEGDNTFMVIASSIALGGDLYITKSNLFDVRTSTVYFTGTSPAGFKTINTMALYGPATFWTLIFNTPETVYANNKEFKIFGNIDFVDGTFDTSGSTVNFCGNLTRTGGNQVQATSGIWIIDGGANQSMDPNNSHFWNLEIDKVSQSTVTFAGLACIDNDISIKNGVLAWGSQNVELAGNLNVYSPAQLQGGNGTLRPVGSKNTIIDMPSYVKIKCPVYIDKDASGYTVSIASPSLEIVGSLDVFIGHLDITNKALKVRGIVRSGSGIMSVAGSTVIVTGDNYSLTGTTLPFNVLIIDNPGASTGLSFNGGITNVWDYFTITPNSYAKIVSGASLIVEHDIDVNGKFEVTQGTVGTHGNIAVDKDGSIDMTNLSQGILTAEKTLKLKEGSILKTGSMSDVICSTSTDTYFGFEVAGGSIDISGLSIFNLNASGLVISSYSYVLNLSSVNFNDCEPYGKALNFQLAGTGEYSFTNIDFDSSVSTNIYVPDLVYPGYVKMLDSKGVKAGYQYEVDPNNVVFWSTAIPPVSFAGVTPTTYSITWDWTSLVPDSLFYRVFASTGGMQSPVMTAVSAWTEEGLMPNTSYQRYVDVYNPIQVSSQSPSAFKWTLTNKPLGTYIAGRSSYSITLDWQINNNPPLETQYLINYSTDGAFVQCSTASYYAPNNAITGLDPYTTYYIQIRASNKEGALTSYDTMVTTATHPPYIAPISTVTYPVSGNAYNSLPTIFGTAFVVAPATVAVVYIELYNVNDDLYYDGGAFNDNTPEWLPATGKGEWTYAVPALTSEKLYRIRTYAKDDYNRDETPGPGWFITFDTNTPVSYIQKPVNNSVFSALALVSGTADDVETSIQNVEIRLYSQTNNNYYDGTQWVVDPSTWLATDFAAPTWDYTLPALTSGYYMLNARALDKANNYEPVFTTSTFYMLGHAVRLLVTAPGQTLAQGSVPGKIGTPTSRVAGVPFDVTVYGVDTNYYVDTTTNSQVTIVTSDDPYNNEPVPLDLVGGTRTFAVTLLKATTSSWVTALSQDLISDTTGCIVNSNNPAKLQLLLPGQAMDPGSSSGSGKSGDADVTLAGASFEATVNLTDNYWNLSTAASPVVGLVASDIYAVISDSQTLVNGTTVFSLTLVTASTPSYTTITAGDNAAAYATNASTITVIPNTGTKLLVVLPGESFAPGVPPYTESSVGGKSGSPSNLPILTPFYVTVRATDDWWNIQPSSNPNVVILTSDPNDADGGSAPLLDGENQYPLTFATEGAWQVNASGVDFVALSCTSSFVNALDATPPCAVSNLTAILGPAHGTVRLMWTAPGDNGSSGNISGGQIWIRYSDGGQVTDFGSPLATWGERLVSTDTTVNTVQSIIVTGLTPWTTYYFAIKVSDGLNFGSWSTSGVNTANYALAKDTALPTITNLQSGDYNWRSVDQGNIYNVDFEDLDSGLGEIEYAAYTGLNLTGSQRIGWTQIAPVAGDASYTDPWGVIFSQLVEYTTNYISVRAYDLAGNVATSYDVFKIFVDTTLPTTPTLVNPADGNGIGSSYSFTWSICSDALSGMYEYQIQLSGNDIFSAVIVDTTSNTNSKTINGMSDGQLWWRVRARDIADNYGAWSSSKTFTVAGTPPAMPTGFDGVALSSTVIDWSWTDNATNESSYKLYFATSPGTGFTSISANATYYLENKLTANTSSYRYVSAFNSNGDSSPSGFVRRFTLANAPVSLASVSVGYSSASFIWQENGNSSVTRYEMQWTTDQTWAIVTGTGTPSQGSTAVISPLAAETTYYTRVRALNNDDKYSDYEIYYSTVVTPVGPPNAPTDFDGVAQSTYSIYWFWTDNNTKEDGYRIYSSTAGLLYQLGVGASYYLETTLTPNAGTIRYVKAYNASGESTASSSATKYTYPLPPVNIASSAQTPTTITLTWEAGSGGAARYYIERSINGTAYEPIVAWATNVSVLTYQDLNLIQNTSYYYRLGAYNTDQLLSAKSDAFAVKTQDAPKEIISGKVTQANGTPITGVEIKASKSGSSITYTVYTSTGGEYRIELEAAIAAGTYKLQASWTANGIVSSVYKDGIANGTANVDFTLETDYVLATVTGQVTIARGPQAIRKMASLGMGSSPAFVELIQNGKVILRLGTDKNGKYSIPNLLPGRYSVRAFNGLVYSQTTVVDLKEGDNLNINFNYDLLQPNNVYAYPNPAADVGVVSLHFETSGDDVDAQISIYTISGELVKSADQSNCVIIDNIYEYKWDLTNNENSKVASAVYIFNVKVRNKTTGETASVTKKFAVIR